MAILDSAKVDLLYKKYFGVTKTDLPANKSPSNESIASPLLVRGDTVWQEASQIPAVAAAVTNLVQAYTGTNAVQCTADSTSVPVGGVYPSWKTNLTDWIPSEFGSTYFIKVYVDSSGVANAQSTGTQIFDSGSGGTGEWNFDYSAGVLNFIGGTIPAVLTGSKVIYVVGYRYIGTKGVTNFVNGLTIGNITINGNTITGNTDVTFGGNISANYVLGNGSLLTGMPELYGNANVAAYLPTYTGDITAGNVTSTFFGNISADVITPYQTEVTVFNNTAAIQLPVGTNSEYPTANVAGYFRYNTTIGAAEIYTGTGWQPLTNTITDQEISPDGSSQTYTLNQPSNAAGVIVSINGTLQSPSSGAYSVAGDQITFAEVPLITDIIDVRFIASSSTTLNLDSTVIDTANITVGTNTTIIDSFGSLSYRSVKYTISSTSPFDSQMSDVLLTQFNGTVSVVTTGNVRTGSNTITYTANISGGTVHLLAQGSTSSNKLRIEKTYFTV